VIPGLYEVRLGTEIFYMDEKGEHIVFPADGGHADVGTGHIIDIRTKKDLTQARIDKLTAIDVDKLPFKDAMVMKQGTGARRLVIFEDPNCGYCKRLERDLVALKDVTIYTFLIPILGGDSSVKARDIWCAKDNAHVWRNWMLNGERAPRDMGKCDFSAIERNTAMAQKYRINGTPAIVFDDGSRMPGAVPLEDLEKALATRSRKS
jgi:thiol:disulfide interchange protein DsbC